MQLLHQIYYFHPVLSFRPWTRCPAKQVGLVVYPNVVIGYRTSVTVTAQCVENAQRISSSLNVTCTQGGRWSQSGELPQCQCDTGYAVVTFMEKDMCLGGQRL